MHLLCKDSKDLNGILPHLNNDIKTNNTIIAIANQQHLKTLKNLWKYFMTSTNQRLCIH